MMTDIVFLGYNVIVKLLIQRGAKFNNQDIHDDKAFFWAVSNGKLQLELYSHSIYMSTSYRKYLIILN